MFLLLIVIVSAVFASALLYSPEGSTSGMAEYCDLECIENKIPDHSICC